MRIMKWSFLVVAVLAVSMYVSPADADSIGPNCGSCFGGIWKLEFAQVGATTYDIFYSVNTAGMTQAGFGNIQQIGFKVANMLVSGSVVSAPAGWGTDAQINTGVNSNGCSGGGNGFLCSDGTGTAGLTVPDGTYKWTFLVDIGNNSLLTGPFAASIKANGSANGAVLSENITLQPVPEPTTLLLVGTVLAGVGVWSRKRWMERIAA